MRRVGGTTTAAPLQPLQAHHPCALEHFDLFAAEAAGKLVAVFLDYDGALVWQRVVLRQQGWLLVLLEVRCVVLAACWSGAGGWCTSLSSGRGSNAEYFPPSG